MQVHIDRGGERYGPYSIEDINAYLANGTLLPTDLAWRDGMTAFAPIHQVPGVVLPGAVATPSAAAPAETTCPQCQTPVEANQLICIGCGTNLNTGETVVIQTGPKPDNRKKFNIDIGQALAQKKYIILGVWCIATPILGYFVVMPMMGFSFGDQLPQHKFYGFVSIAIGVFYGLKFFGLNRG